MNAMCGRANLPSKAFDEHTKAAAAAGGKLQACSTVMFKTGITVMQVSRQAWLSLRYASQDNDFYGFVHFSCPN
jgi:hypothetical protein